MGYIYLITNKITNKRYIGQTLCENIDIRWNQHKRMDKNSIGRYLLSAYNKYGTENFRFQIICICFDDDCNKYEEEYINKYNTIVPNGYNLRSGGKNSKQHPESIQLRVNKLKGKKRPPLSSEQCQQRSHRIKGDKNPNFGKKMTEEQKEKIANSLKTLWKNGVFDKKDTIKKNIKNNNSKMTSYKKPIGKYDANDNLLEKYSSSCEAALKNGVHYSVIGKVCRGVNGYNTAKGFYWKFL